MLNTVTGIVLAGLGMFAGVLCTLGYYAIQQAWRSRSRRAKIALAKHRQQKGE
jgi:hypothetical protein